MSTAVSRSSRAFRGFAEAIARYSGRPAAFLGAAGIVVAWAASGPLFGFGDTWQLVINTGTTIITFLMVFLIQNTQNRDSAALQIKLDELIRATRARNSLLDVDDLDEDTLERIREDYRRLAHDKAEEARQARRRGSRVHDEEVSDEACEEVRAIDRELARAERPDREGAVAPSPSPAGGRAAGG